MATVHIPVQMRDLTAGRAQVEVPGETLRQIVAALRQVFQDELRSIEQFVTAHGAVSRRWLIAFVAISLREMSGKRSEPLTMHWLRLAALGFISRSEMAT